MEKNISFKMAALIASGLFLSGCGGGGGSEENGQSAVDPTPPKVNQAPTANIQTALNVKIGDTIVLDGTVSSDPDQDPLSYSWRIANGREGSVLNSESSTVEVSATHDGTYEVELTVSDGQTWSEVKAIEVAVDLYEPITPPNNFEFTAIALSPSTRGEFTAAISPAVAGGGTQKLVKTNDNGATWVTLLEETNIRSVQYANASSLVVANEDSLSLSKDGGETWTESSIIGRIFGKPVSIFHISVDPLNSDELWVVSRGVYSNKLYRSLNFGLTWEAIDVGQMDAINAGDSSTYHYPYMVVHSKQDPDVLYFTEGTKSRGEGEEHYAIQKSYNNGATWEPVASGIALTHLGLFEQDLSVDDTNHDNLFISEYTSKDGGATWVNPDGNTHPFIIINGVPHSYNLSSEFRVSKDGGASYELLYRIFIQGNGGFSSNQYVGHDDDYLYVYIAGETSGVYKFPIYKD